MEHPFLIVKRYFGFAKTVYRGLAKKHPSAVHPVYQREPADVRTSRQAITTCLRIGTPFFRKKGEK
jgi:hypothetical protein